MTSKPVNWTPELVARAKAYQLEGLSMSQIGAKLGVSSSAVSGVFHRLKHGFDPGRPKPATPKRIYEKVTRDYEVPAPRRNDHLAHCLAVIRANNSCGFPVCDAPAHYRVAA